MPPKPKSAEPAVDSIAQPLCGACTKFDSGKCRLFLDMQARHEQEVPIEYCTDFRAINPPASDAGSAQE